MDTQFYLSMYQNPPEATLRVKKWEDLVAEFGLTEDGNIDSFNDEGEPMCFNKDFRCLCGEEVHFDAGELCSDQNSREYDVYRWECEDPILICEEFCPSEEDPIEFLL